MKVLKAFIKPFLGTTKKCEDKDLTYSFLIVWDWDGKGLVENVAKFQQKIFNSMVVGARQSFQFFRQKAWIHGNNRPLP